MSIKPKTRSGQLFMAGYAWIFASLLAPASGQSYVLPLSFAWATFLTGWIVETIERVHSSPNRIEDRP